MNLERARARAGAPRERGADGCSRRSRAAAPGRPAARHRDLTRPRSAPEQRSRRGVRAGTAHGRPAPSLDQLTDEQLQERVDRLDRAIDQIAHGCSCGATWRPRRPWRARTQARAALPDEPKLRSLAKADEAEARRRGRRRSGGRPGGARRGPAPAEHVKELQNALNGFTGKYLENVTPLMVDGSRGPVDREADPPREVLPRLQGRRAAVDGRHAEAPAAHGASALAALRQPGEAGARCSPAGASSTRLAAQTAAPPRARPAFDGKPVARLAEAVPGLGARTRLAGQAQQRLPHAGVLGAPLLRHVRGPAAAPEHAPAAPRTTPSG